MKHARGLITIAVVSTLAVAVAGAAEKTAGRPGSRQAARVIGTARPAKAAKPLERVVISPQTARSADIEMSPSAFTLIGRSRSGKDITRELGKEVLSAIVKGEAAAPRDVIGNDDRTEVANSTDYPYSAIGNVQMTDANGETWGCAGALVGDYTVLTAARCLYNHNKGGWYETYTFFPGASDGEDVAPWGGFTYDTAYVFSAYVKDYDGTYDSIWKYDIGLLTFTDPIADSTGYLGSSSGVPNDGNFEAMLVGYDADKRPAQAMWSSTCDIRRNDISDVAVAHQCDESAGSDGGPLFYYDAESDDYIIVAVNMGPYDRDSNWALRLYGPIYEWIRTIDP